MPTGQVARGALARQIMSSRQVGRPSVVREAVGFLYSSYFLPTALDVGDYEFFAAAIGDMGGQGYTSKITTTETNIKTANRIPDKTAYAFREFGLYVRSNSLATSLADLDLILHSGYVRIEKTEYKYVYGPAFLIPGGAGISGATGQDAVTANAWNSGVPTPGARIKLPTEIVLDPSEPFNFFYTVTRPQTLTGYAVSGEGENAGVQIWLVLYGKSASEIAP